MPHRSVAEGAIFSLPALKPYKLWAEHVYSVTENTLTGIPALTFTLRADHAPYKCDGECPHFADVLISFKLQAAQAI